MRQVPHFILQCLLWLCLLSGIAHAASPALTSPTVGSVLSSSQAFAWNAQGNAVTNWMLYVGSAVGKYDYYKSNTLRGATAGITAAGLPSNAHKAFVRLRYNIAGVWAFQDYTYYAAGQNHAPTISGTPATSIAIGKAYSFTPTVSDVDGETLTFSIVNKPSWATFNAKTGVLTGTPKATHLGKTSNITLKVKDERGSTTSLTAFSIEVVNSDPLINMARQFGVASQGKDYDSESAASLAIDGDTTTFNHTSCDATNNWWQVKLPDSLTINKLAITSRSSWTSRIKDATVYVTKAAYNGTLNSADKVATLTETAAAQITTFATPKAGSYVIIKAAGANCLHMTEVEVYGQAQAAPVFSQTAYTFNLSEKATQGTVIGAAKAVDYQLNPLTYSLVGTVPFAIDAQGKITLTGALNHNLVQRYSFTVKVSDGVNSVSVPVTVNLGKGAGVYLQRWEGISGTTISDLTNSAHYQNDAPDYTTSLSGFTVTDAGKSNFGQRLTGVIIPAQSGKYQFAIVGDDYTQLRLSGNAVLDDAPLIANYDSWGDFQDWNAAAKSDWISLEAGKVYAAEVLHKEGGGADHVSVAWKREGDASFTTIPAAQLYQDALSAGVVQPAFTTTNTSYLIAWTTAVGTQVAKARAVDPQGDALTYSIVGTVPFSVDAQGNVATNAALQANTTYNFTVKVSDGVYNVSLPLTIKTTAATAVEDVLKSGVASDITNGELLDAALAEVATLKTGSSLLPALYGTDAIAYTQGQGTQLIESLGWLNNVAILVGNQGRPLAMAGKNATARYAAFGTVPTDYFQSSTNLSYEQPFQRLLAWLLAGEPVNTSLLNSTRKVALSYVSSSTRTNFKAWLTKKAPTWTVVDCSTAATLSTCYANVDLIVTGADSAANSDAPTIKTAWANALAAGKPILYMHNLSWGSNDTALALADLLGFNLPYGGNWWAKDAANWANVSAMQNKVWSALGLGDIEAVLTHLKAQDFSFDWSICNESWNDTCFNNNGFASQFRNGASKIQSVMNDLDSRKINLFKQTGASRLYRLLALLGDAYRQEVHFPMDKTATHPTTFVKSLFADYAVYNYRSINPVQPDMGNFSRSDFSHITPITKTVQSTSRQDFRAAGVYALPGKTVRVTRNDTSTTTTQIFVNTLRSGSTHEFDTNSYSRPKFLQSTWMPIKPGETIEFTSPYGGPLEIAYSINDQPVSFTFSNVGEHAFWDDASDNTTFAAKLALGEYDWAEFSTPAFEIHSTLDKMRESASDAHWGGTLEGFAAATMRYTHNFPHVLAGFKGPGIDVVPEIKNFADAKGFTIDNLDIVKHMNADQATCGYGCSGNPYDAYWSFEPIGHGDIHELGHGLESGRFRFSGWEYHASTNPYSYYTKSHYFQDTGGDPDCQNLPFKNVFNALQASVKQSNPASYLQSNLWAKSDWSHQVSMTIQMMMAAQKQGKLLNGWHLLARLHILEREFDRARASNATWDSKKVSLGFSSYTKAEADAISNNDWMLIAVSAVTGLDYRDYLSMWGISYSSKAAAQVLSFSYAVTPRLYFISSSAGYCKGEGFNGNNLPVDGAQVWPLP